MSLQVGSFCYAAPADAGRAACSQFTALSSLNGSTLKTVSCMSADTTTGALNLEVVSTDVNTSISTTTQTTQQISFPPCINQDYLDYVEFIIGGLLSVYIIWLCGWKLLSFLGWSRGENV